MKAAINFECQVQMIFLFSPFCLLKTDMKIDGEKTKKFPTKFVNTRDTTQLLFFIDKLATNFSPRKTKLFHFASTHHVFPYNKQLSSCLFYCFSFDDFSLSREINYFFLRNYPITVNFLFTLYTCSIVHFP